MINIEKWVYKMNVKINGYGLYHPSFKLTNAKLEELVDTSDEWIVSRTGIKNRYIATSEDTTTLAYNAALKAIEDAKIDVNDIGCILVATMTPDYITPGVSFLLKDRLKITSNVFCSDINSACTGFIAALKIGSSLLEDNKYTLVIGAEIMSKIIDYTDRNTCVLFGDSAGAVIISKDTSSYLDFYMNSISDVNGSLTAGKYSINSNLDNKNITSDFLKMNGREVFRFATKVLEESIVEICNKNSLTLDDIDLIIPHQANIRIINSVSKKTKIDIDKFYVNVEEFGNTSAASVPTALAEAYNKGKIKENMNIILVGFGAGFSYGSCLIKT